MGKVARSLIGLIIFIALLATAQEPFTGGLSDQASLFSFAAKFVVKRRIETLERRHGIILRIETLNSLPAESSEWFSRHFKSIPDNGLYALVTLTPARFQWAAGRLFESSGKFSLADQKAWGSAVGESLSHGRYDESLFLLVRSLANYLETERRSDDQEYFSDYPFSFFLWALGLGVLAATAFYIKPHSLVAYLLAAVALPLAWMAGYPEIYSQARYFLPRDNFHMNFSVFFYVAEAFRFFGEMPSWFFLNEGGVPVEPLGNNYLLLLPYRWVGYLLAKATSVPINVLYKISFLWIGQGIFYAGLFVLARKLFRSRGYAVLFVWLAWFSPVHLGVLHQEQAFATVFFIPFIWLALESAARNPKGWVWVGALAGVALNAHHPHLVFFYGVLLLTCGWFFLKIKWPRPKLSHLTACAAAFLIGASPFLYSALNFYSRLTAPDRYQGGLVSEGSFAEYERVARRDLTSVFPSHFLNYLTGGFASPYDRSIAALDDTLFFVTGATTLLLILLPFFKIPHRRFQLSLVIGLGLFALGIYGPAPRLLWSVTPGISFFRQWYHFLPLLNLHLLVLTCYCLQSVLARFSRSVVVATSLLLVLGNVFWSVGAIERYRMWLAFDEGQIDSQDQYQYLRRLLNLTEISPQSIVIRMKGSRPTTESPFFLIAKSGARTAAAGGQVEVGIDRSLNGIELFSGKIPADVVAFGISQFSDGMWRASYGDSQRSVALPVSHEIQIPIASKITLFRERSLWHFLIGIMWAPMVVLITQAAVGKLRERDYVEDITSYFQSAFRKKASSYPR